MGAAPPRAGLGPLTSSTVEVVAPDEEASPTVVRDTVESDTTDLTDLLELSPSLVRSRSSEIELLASFSDFFEKDLARFSLVVVGMCDEKR